GRAQRAQMMRDEVFRTFADPGEIADAKLAAVAQRERDRQSRRIAERPEAGGKHACLLLRGAGGADRLRLREVETEQVAAIIDHTIKLTHVETFASSRTAIRAGARLHSLFDLDLQVFK